MCTGLIGCSFLPKAVILFFQAKGPREKEPRLIQLQLWGSGEEEWSQGIFFLRHNWQAQLFFLFILPGGGGTFFFISCPFFIRRDFFSVEKRETGGQLSFCHPNSLLWSPSSRKNGVRLKAKEKKVKNCIWQLCTNRPSIFDTFLSFVLWQKPKVLLYIS